MRNPANLKKRYESICQDYIDVFCEKQELEFDGWIADEIGGVASFVSQYFFTIDDIAFDINNDIPVGLILSWQDDSISNDSEFKINYRSYSKGLRYSDL